MNVVDGGESAAPVMEPEQTKERPVPPPEPPSVRWTRRWILVSFWAIIACLGLPHWLWTTSIYRASLPLDIMSAWAEGKACQLQYPLAIHLDTTAWDSKAGMDLGSRVEQTLNAAPGLRPNQYKVLIDDDANDTCGATECDYGALTVILEVDDSPDALTHTSSLRTWLPVLDLKYSLSQPRDVDGMVEWVAAQIQHVFEDEQTSLSYLLTSTPFAADGNATLLAPAERAKLDARTTRAFKYASTYHLTLSLFTSGASPSAWEINEAFNQYIRPLVSSLSHISDFTITTQIQLHASLSPSIAGPQYDPASKEWKLQKSDLSGFINAAEWPLSPSIGAGPTINFVLYVPSKDQSPLVIAETGGTGWLIPQWGGVQILNPPVGKTQRNHLAAIDLEPVMLAFADQLTALVGLPPTPSSLAIRIRTLTRERTLSLIMSTSSTLGALARLTQKLSAISIPDSVAQSVASAIQHLDQSCEDLRTGRLGSALVNARTASEESETAFFEPSMVGQVYFPDEHKVAVYVPLLGPMAVPLLMAAIKEIKVWMAARRKVKGA